VLRNPYIAGVERFEVPFPASFQVNEPSHQIGQAAQFCLLLWQHFQPELRTVRYTLNHDYQADTTREFTRQPRLDELIDVDLHNAQQIDIELISQQAAISRNLLASFPQRDEHFPAFLEAFIPLRRDQPQPGTTPFDSVSEQVSESHLVIWCRPDILTKVIALWECAAAFLVNPS
jgi:hypothetical protein